MGKKLVLLIALVVLVVSMAACERPGLTETAVPRGWLLRMLWPTAVTPTEPVSSPHYICFDPSEC